MKANPAAHAPDEDPSLRFRQVFPEEVTEIQRSREKRQQPLPGKETNDRKAPGEPGRKRPLEQDLIGLAFSGGGIRSATFNLGVIQALAKKGLLKRMDYLSTVSGGGYIGSWLSSWAYHFREQAEKPAEIAQQLTQLDLTHASLKSQLGKIQDELKQLCAEQPHLTNDILKSEAALGNLHLKSPTLKDEIAQIAVGLLELSSRQPGAVNQIAAIEEQLNQERPQIGSLPEAREVNFLRKYSNYLTPRLGALSGDTMAFAGTYIRNVVLNQIILLSALLALLLGTHWLVQFVRWGMQPQAGIPLAVAATGLLWWISWRITRNMNPKKNDAARGVIWLVAVPEFLFCFVVTWLLRVMANPSTWGHSELTATTWPERGLVVAAVAGAYTVLWGLAGWFGRGPAANRNPLTESRSRWAQVKWAPLAGLVAGGGVLMGARLFEHWHARTLLTFGVPFATLTVLLVGVVHLGLIGREYPDSLREWWARMGGAVLAIAIQYFALCLVSLYVPRWLLLFWQWLVQPSPQGVAGWSRLWKMLSGLGVTGAISGWIGITLRGLFVAKSDKTGSPSEGTGSRKDDLLVRIAPVVFAAGLFIIMSLVVREMVVLVVGHPAVGEYAAGWWKLVVLAALLLGLSLGMGLRVDVNEFSLHNAYRNRIVRCYMGATNPTRDPQMFTGFDEKDNIFLHSLEGLGTPLHILNATLNIVKGKELAVQTRKASSFTFTPLYSGFDYVDDQAADATSGKVAPAAAALAADSPTTTASFYRKTADYSKSSLYPGARLGTAMAISGAAVSPNMGHYSSGSVAFLLTIFGARLGWWLGNPREKKAWESGRPRSSWRALFRELTSSTDDLGPEVYLSDGGHFDNLGVYELVRRRCRVIIAIDAGADEKYGCEDLASVVEKCRVDFRTEIKIKLDGVGCKADRPYWVGEICYPGDGPRHPGGKLIYVKPCLIPRLPQDVLAHAHRHRNFPNSPTSDQFFDESQFESYRALGYACATAAVGEILPAINS